MDCVISTLVIGCYVLNFYEDPISNFYVKLLTDRQTNKCW